MNKAIARMQAGWNNLNPSTKATVKGVGTAAVVGALGLASAQSVGGAASLDYSALSGAGKTEVVSALQGGGPAIAALGGMVGGAGWILRKLFNI